VAGARRTWHQWVDTGVLALHVLSRPGLPAPSIGGVHAHFCRNPTLTKCGGEAQHLEKLEVWSPPGLPNVQSSIARPKTPRIEVFLVSLERS